MGGRPSVRELKALPLLATWVLGRCPRPLSPEPDAQLNSVFAAGELLGGKANFMSRHGCCSDSEVKCHRRTQCAGYGQPSGRAGPGPSRCFCA